MSAELFPVLAAAGNRKYSAVPIELAPFPSISGNAFFVDDYTVVSGPEYLAASHTPDIGSYSTAFRSTNISNIWGTWSAGSDNHFAFLATAGPVTGQTYHGLSRDGTYTPVISIPLVACRYSIILPPNEWGGSLGFGLNVRGKGTVQPAIGLFSSQTNIGWYRNGAYQGILASGTALPDNAWSQFILEDYGTYFDLYTPWGNALGVATDIDFTDTSRPYSSVGARYMSAGPQVMRSIVETI